MAIIAGIAIGGALGALARYGLSLLVAQHMGTAFPWATLVINVSGSFILALFMPLSLASVGSPLLRLTFATGFVGAYTTFSTFIWEASGLVREHNLAWAGLYVAASVLLGLTAAWLGYTAAQAMLSRGVFHIGG